MPNASHMPFYRQLCRRATEVGLHVVIDNRRGLLFLRLVKPGFGTIAMWPALNGSIELTAKYALECYVSANLSERRA